MYLKITERCNMLCEHCGFSCTDKGEDMSLKVFKAALDYFGGDDYVSIGGGEPTVHPKFWQFLFLALSYPGYNVWVVTNGKRTSDALRLAELDRKLRGSAVFAADLSLDEYHETVELSVVKAFGESIRAVKIPFDVGRAKDLSGSMEGCVCPDLIVLPNGDIKKCGCAESPILGNVLSRENRLLLEDGCYLDMDCREEA